MNKAKTVNVEIPASEAKSYPIIISQGILQNIGTELKKFIKAKKILVITNETVDKLYSNIVKNSLNKENYNYEFVVLTDGEKYKNLESLESIWTKAIEYKLERKDAIIALGGGVIGDISGFAAATYLRGIDFVQVPTTLLAMVDSSVGGKVAINQKLGKNLIGNFYQPKLVFSDINALKTLPIRQLKVGLAEILKYGFIEKSCGLKEENINLIQFLKNNKDAIFNLEPEIMSELIEYCCKLKAVVVNQDEKETGLRAILNFGHTIGHAVEKCTGYEQFNHGEAVAIGMKGAFYIGLEKGIIDEEYYNEALNLINLYELNLKIPETLKYDDFMKALKVDKKVQDNTIRFVLPTRIADVGIYNDITENQISIIFEYLKR